MANQPQLTKTQPPGRNVRPIRIKEQAAAVRTMMDTKLTRSNGVEGEEARAETHAHDRPYRHIKVLSRCLLKSPMVHLSNKLDSH
jgi:hypothetical protein